MSAGFFITGTDTNVGKTTVALGLMTALQQQGLTVAAFKPVSAGCARTADGLRNDDAVRLMQQASVDIPYDTVNPYAFEPPIAPHIAAAETNTRIDLGVVKKAYLEIAETVDIVIVEGAGGWLVPVTEQETMADLAVTLGLPVINVVGIRLGCLNHALLTTQSIIASGLHHGGWIANHLSTVTERSAENVDALRARITAPLLSNVPFGENPANLQNAARFLTENMANNPV